MNLTFDAMSSSQENFVVSARKYRPETWEEVIGQETITETLDQSIQQDHLAHAYLFCGPRGVGKTTCARIFAREINREEGQDDDIDFSFNIFEMDAASNNGVDEMRNLTDQVRIPPQVGKYKVYIIDEVHMLSKQAFNAFLKTLEEPPKHAVFILATTEKHKIIPTILSRCQIYDFNRITVEAIVEQLKHIAEKENVTYEEEALHVIAQKADGAMRDGLSIFDQLTSFTNGKLTYAEVLKNLHVLDYDYFFKMTKFLYEQSYSEAILMLDEVLRLGFDGAHFIHGLANHLRDLLVCQHPNTEMLLEVGKSVQAQYKAQAQAIPSGWIKEALPLVSEAEFRYRTAPNARLLIEVTLLQVSSLHDQKKNDERPQRLSEPAQPLKPEAKAKTPTEPVASEIKSPAPAQVESSSEPEQEEESSSTVDEIDETAPIDEPVTTESQSEISIPSSPPITEKSRKRRTTRISLDLDNETSDEKIDQPSQHTEAKSIAEVQTIAETGENPISPVDAWQSLSNIYLKEGKNALYSIMTKQDMDSQFQDQTFQVYLGHDVDQEEFVQHSTDVLERLRGLTKDQGLQLTTEVKAAATKTKLFTTQEKYEHLVNKNPKLDQLRRDLDLDFI